MSHFTRIQTRMSEGDHVFGALKDLGLQPQRGDALPVRGWQGRKQPAEIVLPSGRAGYDIGFRKPADTYECVADWSELRATIDQAKFLREVQQRYAYHATKAQLEAQGFSLAGEETTSTGQIRLTLRRAS